MFKVLKNKTQKEYGQYFKECQKNSIVLVTINQMKNYSLVRSDTDTCKCIRQDDKPNYSAYQTKLNHLMNKYKAFVLRGSWGQFSNIAIKREYAEDFAEELYMLLMTLADMDCKSCQRCEAIIKWNMHCLRH